MSERTEVEVLFPLNRVPSRAEQRAIKQEAFREARELVHPGRVLGLVSVARANHHITGELALKFRFAVEAPESIQPTRTTFATS